MKQLATFNLRLAEIDLLVREATAALSTNLAEDRDRGNVLTRAGVVLLSGYFEGFLRELLREFIEEVNDAEILIHTLPSPTVEITLEAVVKKCRAGNATARSSLVQLVSGGQIADLDHKLFCETGGNPTVSMIDDLFDAVGIPQVIENLSKRDFNLASTFITESQVDTGLRASIGKCLSRAMHDPTIASIAEAEIITIIERRWTPKTKRRSVGYVHQINELLKKRNRIAHGEGYEMVTDRELLDFRNHLATLAQGLSAELDAQLAFLLGSQAS